MRSVAKKDESRRPAADLGELLVLWQHPESRAMVPVGILSFDGSTYRFEYLPAARHVGGFRPLLGFRDLEASYSSDQLFPLFQERVLDPTRPDFFRVLEKLDLDVARATPWEQLVRTGGASEGDTIQVTPFPRETDGGWGCTFLAAGLRYFMRKAVTTRHGVRGPYSSAEFETLLAALMAGDPLTIEPEIGNEYSADAQLMLRDGAVVGYLPDWLARLVAPLLAAGAPVTAEIVRVNEPAAGWHLRMLVELRVQEPYGDADRRLRTETVAAY